MGLKCKFTNLHIFFCISPSYPKSTRHHARIHIDKNWEIVQTLTSLMETGIQNAPTTIRMTIHSSKTQPPDFLDWGASWQGNEVFEGHMFSKNCLYNGDKYWTNFSDFKDWEHLDRKNNISERQKQFKFIPWRFLFWTSQLLSVWHPVLTD